MASSKSAKSTGKSSQSNTAAPRQAVGSKVTNGGSKGLNSSVAAKKGTVVKGSKAKAGKSK